MRELMDLDTPEAPQHIIARLERELQHGNEQLQVEHQITLHWKDRALAAEQQLERLLQKHLGSRWQPPVLSAEVRQAIEEAVRQGHAQRERILQQKAAEAERARQDEIPYPERPWWKEPLSHTEPDGLSMWASTPLTSETESCTMVPGCHVPAVAKLTYEAARNPTFLRFACVEHGTGWVHDHILRHIRLAPR
jgi:hypothetical protein